MSLPDPQLITLRDGSVVTIRPVNESDEVPIGIFLHDLCLEARRLRFFTGAANLANVAHWAANTAADGCGLIMHDDAGVVVGHAGYAQLSATRAEVAVEVADHLHGRGLGTILIERLTLLAEQRGITQFVAEVLPDNRAMLDVFRDGFDAHVAFHDGVETVEFPTSAWRLADERFMPHAHQQCWSIHAPARNPPTPPEWRA